MGYLPIGAIYFYADIIFVGFFLGYPFLLILLIILTTGKSEVLLKFYNKYLSTIVTYLILFVIISHYYLFSRELLSQVIGGEKQQQEIIMDISYLVLLGVAFLLGLLSFFTELYKLNNPAVGVYILEGTRTVHKVLLAVAVYVIILILLGFIAINFY